MTNKIYNLFRDALPELTRDEDLVNSIIADEENHIIKNYDGDTLLGVSIIYENTIYLLCVAKAHQRTGIGAKLLEQSEAYIASQGHKKVVVGVGRTYITPGIPMLGGAEDFFKKRGYRQQYADERYFDMDMMLADFVDDDSRLGDTIGGIRYRLAEAADIGRICACMADAEESFVEYYSEAGLYGAEPQPRVLMAETLDKSMVLGAVIIGMECMGEEFATIGCTATRQAHRGAGIASNMVRLATRYLKDIGANYVYINYTYSGIMSIYARSGYKVCMEYFMGEKAL